MPGPPNSSALYVAPSAPSCPMSVSMRSLASTPSAKAPETSMRNVSGTRSQVLPLAMPTATSVLPMPVANAPKAPAMQVCESAPMTRSPGLAKLSATRWWQTPISTSLSVAPDSAQKARMVFCALASSLRGAGAAWSMKNTHSGALTRSAPSSSICWMASGPVPSCAMATSTSQTTIWPGTTESRPACAARSFSASVAAALTSRLPARRPPRPRHPRPSRPCCSSWARRRRGDRGSPGRCT